MIYLTCGLAVVIVVATWAFMPDHPGTINAYRPAPQSPLACETWQVNCNAHGGCEQHCERCGSVVRCRPGAR